MSTKLLQICFILTLGLVSCGGDKVPPISDRIQNLYRAQSVSHDGTVVFTLSGSSNLVPEYSSFRLELNAAGQASLKDVTSETFAGSYAVNGNTLTLSGLNPQPTGSGGTITYDITSISDDGKNLVLTATKANPKTSNSINVYTLVAQ